MASVSSPSKIFQEPDSIPQKPHAISAVVASNYYGAGGKQYASRRTDQTELAVKLAYHWYYDVGLTNRR